MGDQHVSLNVTEGGLVTSVGGKADLIAELKELSAESKTTLLDIETSLVAHSNNGFGRLVYDQASKYVGPDHPAYVAKLFDDALKIGIQVVGIPDIIQALERAERYRDLLERCYERIDDDDPSEELYCLVGTALEEK